MNQRTPPDGSQPRAESTSRAGARADDLLLVTLQQLEDVRARAGEGQVAERLRAVCDRLRSAKAALGRERDGAPSAEPESSPRNAPPETGRVPPNETERY